MSSVPSVPSSSPSEPETNRVELPSRDGESLRSSGSRKLSVFGWSRTKRSSTSNSSDRPRQTGSGSAASKGKCVGEPVAEMSEDRGPERHELPAGVMPLRRSPTLQEHANYALPFADERFAGSFPQQSSSRYHSPNSIHGGGGIASTPERSQPTRILDNAEREIASNGGIWGNWYANSSSCVQYIETFERLT